MRNGELDQRNTLLILASFLQLWRNTPNVLAMICGRMLASSHSPADVIIRVLFLFLARLPGQPGQAEVTGASVSFHEIIFPIRLVRDNWPVEVRADINL